MLASAGRLRRLCGHKPSFSIDGSRRLIPVMMPHPIGQVVAGAGFVASLGREVEVHVGGDNHFVSAPVGGIGVKYLAGLVLVEEAEAGELLAHEIASVVVVIGFPCRDFLYRG